MKIICVDDEELLVEDAVATCLELPQIDEAIGSFGGYCAAGY